MAEKEKVISPINDLISELTDSQDALQNLVFQKSMQQLEDLSQIKKTRKSIARIKTLINENSFSDNN
jgi:ribosomal protein L29|tara:strand:+ start:3517 stop:3717 length:201 start_codon:yes stop_codon:yes gene_type:complete